MDAPRVEALLGDQESLAFAAEPVRGRDPHVVVDDLRVTAELAELLLRVLHRRHVAQDVHPGVSAGTMNIVARWWGRASGSVTAITIRKSAIEPFEVNHLCPVIT